MGRPQLVAGAVLASIFAGACGGSTPAGLSASLSCGPASSTVSVDPSAPGTSISPFIYGVAAGDPAVIRALGATVARWGGNQSTTYNWVNGHAWNAARDWDFRNANYGQSSGSAADNFIRSALGAGAAPLMTVPMIGWVARDDNNQTQSVGVPADGGAPLKPGSESIAGYDPTHNQMVTSVPSYARGPASTSDALGSGSSSSAVYQDEWIRHLKASFGVGPNGVALYAMDNEPDLWSSTHTDVHPVRMSYDDMLRVFLEYSSAVKGQAPNAKVLGPDVSGWTGYFYSALDQGSDKYATHADQQKHGGVPFLEWWMKQVAGADKANGRRSLDYLDVHYYPQAQGVFSAANDPSTAALRVRSTRSLFDPSYTDESWIGQPVDLIPRLKQWIAESYPGTKLAITEYNWGGEKEASGAVALANVLGTFGTQGVDLATYWWAPPLDSPAGAAFRLYRNFDGQGGTFGDVSIPARSGCGGITAFAARHSIGGTVDVIVVNQDPTRETSVRLDVAHGTPIAAYQVLGGSSRIDAVAPPASGGSFKLPGYSLALVRFKVG
jgi:Glycoside hydrolase family 44